MAQLRQERDELAEFKRHADEEVNTLRRVVQHHEQESKNRQSMFESKLAELENVKNLPKSASGTHLTFVFKESRSESEYPNS